MDVNDRANRSTRDGRFCALNEPPVPLQLMHCAAADANRPRLEAFVQDVFRHTYGAEVNTFCPGLLALHHPGEPIAAVAGVRPADSEALFSEIYLGKPVERRLAEVNGRPVRRASIAEIGNLAPAGAGQARWLIATLTAYLYAAGFEWVVFTSIPMVFNAFARLGLPLSVLAEARAQCLPAGARANWGTYYDARPMVYAGHVKTGYYLLRNRVDPTLPRLVRLWHQALEAGAGLAAGGSHYAPSRVSAAV